MNVLSIYEDPGLISSASRPTKWRDLNGLDYRPMSKAISWDDEQVQVLLALLLVFHVSFIHTILWDGIASRPAGLISRIERH